MALNCRMGWLQPEQLQPELLLPFLEKILVINACGVSDRWATALMKRFGSARHLTLSTTDTAAVVLSGSTTIKYNIVSHYRDPDSTFASLLQRLTIGSNVRSITIKFPRGPKDVVAIITLLDSCGSTLRHFDICYLEDWLDLQLPSVMAVNGLTHLRISAPYDTGSAGKLLSGLLVASSSTLIDLSISITSSRNGDIHVCSLPQLRNLKLDCGLDE
ncbi:hypothetical protein HK101_000772 [Irineochytrium annulatum]|nr:hypothetical protein HK101_000772 [Irineochytrium annulatum]